MHFKPLHQPDMSIIADNTTLTVASILNQTTLYLSNNNIDNPRLTADILLSHVLGIEKIDLYLQHDRSLSYAELTLFKALVQRRIKKEPVAYILSNKEFFSMDIAVNCNVLIPRPESELLVEEVFSYLSKNMVCSNNSEPIKKPSCILELGTGSGAIIIALAAMCSENRFFASDISKKAIELAMNNAKRYKLDQTITFFAGDWFDPINSKKTTFDIIISNPPYIPTHKIYSLQPEIRKYEPFTALDGGSDGLCSIRNIIDDAHNYLKKGGYLFLEIGYDQKKTVQKYIDHCGHYSSIDFVKDYIGYDRIVKMQKK